MVDSELFTISLQFELTGLLVTFGIMALGLLLGEVRIRSISFGTSGVLLVAMAAGYFYQVQSNETLQQLGILLFLWAVGLEAGPNFFRSFQRMGRSYILMSLFLLAVAGFTVTAGTILLAIPGDLALGLFSGAFTSTPALVSAAQVANRESVVLGYGIAYPFGLLTMILFIQISVKLLAHRFHVDENKTGRRHAAVFQIENTGIDRQLIKDIHLFSQNDVIATHIRREETVMPALPSTMLMVGDLIRIEAKDENSLSEMEGKLGKRTRGSLSFEGELDTRSVVVENVDRINRSLRDLGLRLNYQVTVSRVIRSGFEIYPEPDLIIQYGDIMEVVGSPYRLNQMELEFGHKHHSVEPRVDIASLAVMLFFSLLAGSIILPVAGLGNLSAGIAGGALITGLIFGHFGRIGRFIGRFPLQSTRVMKEFGLALFFVEVGLNTGRSFVDAIGIEAIVYILFAIFVAIIPVVSSFYIGYKKMKLSLIECYGVICGAMTFTPGLDIIRQIDDSDRPVIAYSSVYPVSLILVIVLVQALNVFFETFLP